VEIIDLAGEVCPTLPPYPFPVQLHTAAFLRGRVVVCGGQTDNDGSSTNQCFALGPESLDEWVEIEPYPDGTDYSRKSSVVNDEWFITGGEGHHLSSLLFNGNDFNDGPVLPFQKEDHCQLTLPDGLSVFITAGEGLDNEKTFVRNFQSGEWDVLDDLPASLITDPACGFVNNPFFGAEVIVASGTNSFSFGLFDRLWKPAPFLPQNLIYMSYAQVEGGFLSIGGRQAEGSIDVATDIVYKFDAELYTWVEVARLSQPKYFSAAVPVPNDFLNCQ